MTDCRCLTPKEFASERRISTRTVYRLIRDGKLKAERVGDQWRIWMRHTGHVRTPTPEQTQ